MAKNIKKDVQKIKDISYTNKDFASLRNELRNYMLTHFSDKVVDFSDSSLGGMFLDLGAYVGDVMTYYLDHQFNELSIETAVESDNLERLIREAGVKIPSAAPAYSEIDITIVTPAIIDAAGIPLPSPSALPIVKTNSIFSSPDGTRFYQLEDVDFSEVDEDGKLLAKIEIANVTASGTITDFFVSRKSIVSSAAIEEETFDIGSNRVPFRVLELAEENINEIISVTDSGGDSYYEVDSLSQDTVFKSVDNHRNDRSDTPFRLELMHAPKRYVSTRSINTGKTYLRFGAGSEDSFDEDVIPDPSEHAIKLYGDRNNFSNVAIDPNSFLTTQTLGISPQDTTLTVRYRHGGGVAHNISAGSINSVDVLITQFSTSTAASIETSVRASVSVVNKKNATGGEDEPTLEELRQTAIFNRSSQNRIVTREDMIARVYSMPSRFGRVFRVAVSDNPRNTQAAQLYVISRNKNNKLIMSSDTLKLNLAKYLNEFRIVSDAIDILDAIIINIGLNISITVEKGFRQDAVASAVVGKLTKYFNIKNMQINKPVPISELENIILNTPGVYSFLSLSVVGKSGILGGNSYNSYDFNVIQHIDRGLLFPSMGGMFEIKYPSEDIKCKVI